MNNTRVVPVYAKPIHYNTNGTGRDIYIYSNQGGFVNSGASTNLSKRDQMNYDKMRHGRTNFNQQQGFFQGQRNPSPGQQSYQGKIKYYQSNGSGRDSYISYDNGGYTSSQGANKNGAMLFTKNLRNYQKITQMPLSTQNFVQKSNTSRSTSSGDMFKQKLLTQSQNFLTKKLSQPKWVKAENVHNVESSYRFNSCGSVKSMKNMTSIQKDAVYNKAQSQLHNGSVYQKQQDRRRQRSTNVVMDASRGQNQNQNYDNNVTSNNNLNTNNSYLQQELQSSSNLLDQQQVGSSQNLNKSMSSSNLRKIMVHKSGKRDQNMNSSSTLSPQKKSKSQLQLQLQLQQQKMVEQQYQQMQQGKQQQQVLQKQNRTSRSKQSEVSQSYQLKSDRYENNGMNSSNNNKLNQSQQSINKKMNLTQRLFNDRFMSSKQKLNTVNY